MKYWLVLIAVVLLLTGFNAEAARRLGGGRSVGQQSSNVAQRQAAPAQGATNSAANKAAPAPTQTPPAAAPAAAPRKPWGAMLGGLAAGLGLAWLANSLGLGDMAGALGQIVLFALLALAVMLLVGWFMRSRRPAAAPPAFAWQGASANQAAVPAPASYRPENVGNDASARPWERSAMSFEPTQSRPSGGAPLIGSGLQGSQSWGIPAGFDAAGFLQSAKANFITLQAAWDRSDIPGLRAMMTDAMLQEIRTQLAERETLSGTQLHATEVVMLEAQLLGIEELPQEYLASVEFSGMIREDASAGPNPFREVWNMSKQRDGRTGWLVAGVQALQ